MRTLLISLIAASLSGLAGLLPAADLFDYTDIRLGAATVGTSSEVRSTAGNASSTSKESWDSARRVSLDGIVGIDLVLIGVAGGVGIVQEHRKGDGLTEDTYVGRLQAGPYIDFGPLTFELLGQVGVGNATLRPDNGEDSTASRSEYGATLNILLPIPALPLVVGANVGYLHTENSHSYDIATVPTDVKITGGDYTAGLLVGLRF